MNPVWVVLDRGQTVAKNFKDWDKCNPSCIIPPTENESDILNWMNSEWQPMFNPAFVSVLKYSDDGELEYNGVLSDWQPDMSHEQFVDLRSDLRNCIAEWVNGIRWDGDDEELEEVLVYINELDVLDNIGENNLNKFCASYSDYWCDGDHFTVNLSEFRTSQREIAQITERDMMASYRNPQSQ